MYQIYVPHTLISKDSCLKFHNRTHSREWYTISRQRIIEVQFKVTERITLLLCLYLLFLRLNSSHGQWREFKPIRFPLSWSSNERRKGLTNGKYCNRLRRRSRLRHAQMTLLTKVTLRIKPGNTVTQWKLTCNVFLVVGKKDRFKKNYDRNLLRYS